MTAQATELAYDSVTLAHLPEGGGRYFGYVNGKWANYTAVKARFPDALVMGIDVNGTAPTAARIVDYEKGDVQSLGTLRSFVEEREKYRPHSATVYCDRANLDAVEADLAGLWHVLWVSTLDGTKLAGTRTARGNLIVATQYAGGETALFDTTEALASWR